MRRSQVFYHLLVRPTIGTTIYEQQNKHTGVAVYPKLTDLLQMKPWSQNIDGTKPNHTENTAGEKNRASGQEEKTDQKSSQHITSSPGRDNGSVKQIKTRNNNSRSKIKTKDNRTIRVGRENIFLKQTTQERQTYKHRKTTQTGRQGTRATNARHSEIARIRWERGTTIK